MQPLKFDLPFHNNDEYISWLNQNRDDVYSVYFSAPTALAPDARIHSCDDSTELMVEGLSKLDPSIKKYITFNGRYTPHTYYRSDYVEAVTRHLKALHAVGGLTGILYLDFYYLQIIAKHDPEFYSQLEAVPSINCFIDSIDKVNSHLMYLSDAGMKRPSKIILDRSLNRRMGPLKTTATEIRKRHPDLQIELLVNEGCLYNCPFKVNHDIVISQVNEKTTAGQQYVQLSAKGNDFNIQRLNEDYGCIDYLQTHPSRFFEMPFIRPEDLPEYDDLFDIAKISGKILPNQTVFKIVDAYQREEWNGNLLELLDAAGSLRDNHYIFNDEIPDNFHKMLTTCDKNCLKCKFCDRVADNTVQRISTKDL